MTAADGAPPSPGGDDGVRSGSGEDRGERVVQLAGVVEHALAERLGRPHRHRAVAVGQVATGEDLVAVARRVEEVDRLAAGDAVAGGADVDRHVVHREQVRGAADLDPVTEPEGEVVQLGVGAGEHGELVDLVVARHPGRDDVGVGVQAGLHALGRVEVEDRGEEAVHQARVLGGDQRVVERGHTDTDEVAREGVRVVGADLGADAGGLVVDLEDVVGGGREPDAVADLRVLALAHPLDGDAEGLGLLLDVVDVAGVLDLPAELHQADATLLEDDRVVVPLVPGLVVDLVALGVGLVETHRVGVVLLGLGHVRDADMGVAHPHDSHCYSLWVVPAGEDAAA